MKTITEFKKDGVQTEYYEKAEVDKQIKELEELIVLQDMKIASYLEELGEN